MIILFTFGVGAPELTTTEKGFVVAIFPVFGTYQATVYTLKNFPSWMDRFIRWASDKLDKYLEWIGRTVIKAIRWICETLVVFISNVLKGLDWGWNVFCDWCQVCLDIGYEFCKWIWIRWIQRTYYFFVNHVIDPCWVALCAISVWIYSILTSTYDTFTEWCSSMFWKLMSTLESFKDVARSVGLWIVEMGNKMSDMIPN